MKVIDLKREGKPIGKIILANGQRCRILKPTRRGVRVTQTHKSNGKSVRFYLKNDEEVEVLT